ncbi:MAG: hypothetical protein ACI4IF_03125 [Acutalibacteraceae bacterium]
MKMKKALAVLLTVVMLVASFSLCAFAAGSVTIVSNPIKTVYKDSEFFNPQGLAINDGVGDVYYTPDNADFRFSPALNEFLSVDTSEVVEGEVYASGATSTQVIKVYYQNAYVGDVTVTVGHDVDTTVYDCEGYYHGHYCKGCAKFLDKESCADHVTNWVPNDDQGLLKYQTETGKCDVCGNPVTRQIKNSDGFGGEIMNGFPWTDTELQILDYFYKIVVSLVNALLSIK